MVRARRPLGDALLSVGALAVLLTVLVSFDARVREQVALRMTSGDARAELVGAGVQLRDLTGVLVQAARDQTIVHAPMAIFIVSTVVLVVFMLRT